MTETVSHSLHEDLERAVDLVRQAERLAVTAHVNPDADAIGSVLGLTLGLRALGKTVTPVLTDPVPEYARFLHGSEQIQTHLSGPYDLLLAADAADIERLGGIYQQNRELFAHTPILDLDHHRTNPRYGTVNYVDAAASSTSELALRLLTALGAPLDAATATALIFGLSGDTGSFRNAATTPGALAATARLVEAGGDIERVAFQLFEWKTFAAVKVWGGVLSSATLDRERHIIFALLTQEMLQANGGTMDETEGVAEFLRGVEEAEVVMLLKETEEGEIRVSMRSRPAIDVAAIATALGGGGHRQAAGLTLPGPAGAARRTLVETYDRLNRA